MFLDKVKIAGMVALTLVILSGGLLLNSTGVAFAADRTAQPASAATPNAVRLRLCNVDGDHDADDVCRVIGGRLFFGNGFFMGNGFSMRNRFLLPSNLDTDNDATFPLKIGPFPRNFGY
jgi:hypothetical protein